MQLTWKSTTCPIFGAAFELQGLKEGETGMARKHAGRYMAHAFIDGRYLSHCARTARTAMTRLEREIDKRSIGLLGVDDVTFTVAL